MLKNIRKTLVASVIGIGFLAGNALAAAPASSYSGVTIFGDSLLDTGNVLSLTSSANPLFGFPSYPTAPGRFSNGPAWVEYLASGLGYASSANPSNLIFDGSSVIAIGATGGQNYGFGGARTGLGGSAGDTTGLIGQLIAWDNSTSILSSGALTRAADPDALYVVMAGANDLRDIRDANSATDLASIAQRAAAASAIATNITGTLGLLANAGARHFLISNLPDLGLTPEAVSLGRVAASKDVTDSFNSAFLSLTGSFEAQFNQANNVDLDIRTLDFYGLFNDVVDDANNHGGATFGITNVTSACLSPGPLSQQYFFFDATESGCSVAGFSDELHPSGTAHELLGTIALQAALAPVPEPSEFALMIGGLLLIGGAVRRRRARAAV